VRGRSAYGGPARIGQVEVSTDNGNTWNPAAFIGPDEPHAWRQWQFIWHVEDAGDYTLMARVTDTEGNRQPESADWNVLGYGNNGIREHAVKVTVGS